MIIAEACEFVLVCESGLCVGVGREGVVGAFVVHVSSLSCSYWQEHLPAPPVMILTWLLLSRMQSEW